MGTNYNGDGSSDGIIPKVLETIFNKVKATNDSTEFLIRVSFIEVNNAMLVDEDNFSELLKLDLLKIHRYSRKRFLICLIPIHLKER